MATQAIQPEDYNLPSKERVSLLERLQVALGDVPPHFWAACHLCDLQELELLARTAELNPNVVRIVGIESYTMIAQCKLNIIRLFYVVTNILQGINLFQDQVQVQIQLQVRLLPLYLRQSVEDCQDLQALRQPKGKNLS
jgi:hypothetical protein